MNGWVVADSGIFIAVILTESYTPQAQALVRYWSQQGIQIAAPELFHYEIVAVMRKSVVRQRLTPAEANSYLEILLAQPVHTMKDDRLLRRAYELATRFNRPTAYDSQYLAVAERLSCEFWTADERFFNVLAQDLKWVKWVNGFSPQ